MKKISFSRIVTDRYIKGALIRNDFPGFKEDYLTIHCLIKKYKPFRFMEIGTSTGKGTNVICNAMGISRFFPKNWERVMSLDVPPGTDSKKIYPGAEDGHPRRAGMYCKRKYLQLYGNSIKFDFEPFYPIDAWFIDGKHNYEYAKKDTLQALKSEPKLVIWHDMQIEGVEKAVIEVMKKYKSYSLFRVKDTRIGFAVRESKN